MLGVSRFLVRHKTAVATFWLVMLQAGPVASAKLGRRLPASSPFLARRAARRTGRSRRGAETAARATRKPR
jgi:hypothetical protein